MKLTRALLLGSLASIAMSGLAFSMADDTSGGGGAPQVETKTIIKQNGIKRPDAGTATGKLWDIADEISEAKGAPALRKEVTDRYMAEQPNANIATANTQYARWVTFHGVSELIKTTRAAEKAKAGEADAAAKAEAKKKADEAKAAKDAEKAEKAQKKADEKAAKDAAKAKEKAEKDAAKAAEKQRKADEKAAEAAKKAADKKAADDAAAAAAAA